MSTVPERARHSPAGGWPSLLLLSGILLFIGAIVFRDFLFGAALLVYKDSGSDSINDYYPSFLHLSDYVRREGIPSWSFFLGMGQDLYYLAGYLILEPVCWLTRSLIAPALVYQHLVKILLAGFFFFRFLQLRRLSFPASILGALLVSFSAYMSMGACWYPFADEVVCYTALLLAVEIALQSGRWLFLTLVSALAGFLDVFHLYLTALFLLGYVPARLFLEHGWRPVLFLRTGLKLGAAALLGVAVGAFYTLPNLYMSLNSPRGTGGASGFKFLSSQPVFSFASPLYLLTATLRPFANDLIGTAEAFKGWSNYLEAPLTYGGLLCLLLLPQVFVVGRPRLKLVTGMFLALLALTTAFPWFRHLFWLFQGDYNRALSLFSVLGVVALSAYVFSSYARGKALSIWLLASTGLVLAGILYLPAEMFRTRIDPQLRTWVTVALAAYTVTLIAGELFRRRAFAILLILAFAVTELALFNYITVARRQVLTKQDVTSRTGYNDDTIEALQDIRAADPSSFYRITKIRASSLGVLPSLNDALVFGYYGTPYYSSFNNRNYIRFLVAVGAIPPDSEIETRYALGLLNDSMLSLFAGEKYVLTNAPQPWQHALQYEFVKRYEHDYLFRNARFVPFGLTFDRFILEAEFLKLPAYAKAHVLLRTAVVSDQAEAARLGLSRIQIPDLEEEIRKSTLTDVVEARRASGLELTSFRQTRIEGHVNVPRDGVLVLQTPFDRGWRAAQDGRPAPTSMVDIGLLAVAVNAGAHNIQLKYTTPFLHLGLGISSVALLVFFAGLWRYRRFTPAGL